MLHVILIVSSSDLLLFLFVSSAGAVKFTRILLQKVGGTGRRQTRHSTDPEIEIKFNKSCKIASSSEDNLPRDKRKTNTKPVEGKFDWICDILHSFWELKDLLSYIWFNFV